MHFSRTAQDEMQALSASLASVSAAQVPPPPSSSTLSPALRYCMLDDIDPALHQEVSQRTALPNNHNKMISYRRVSPVEGQEYNDNNNQITYDGKSANE
ncbi:hypothetical protein DL766_008617 [Monosporascus sp. MC13-8B]|uniref:Uncharacterized protein n=1 Tax=Monosporascus cannonballus TaxID=155416 RepID=A0ABY0GWI7_9PEZI|nr:hypothetical protein DL762_008419 [Monosporascus cannonballus]RYO82084.1 hypothetical protein DL763_008355 [Monosporascus cannonballus]RYP18684.1 hypothetical protein DL766_008617 [Monosporascus sp. MC13-8B]